MNNEKNTWYWLIYGNMKSHLCGGEMLKPIKENLTKRSGAELEKEEVVTGREIEFYLPGMVYLKRKEYVFKLPGIFIRMPAKDLEIIRDMLLNYPVRNDGGGEYKKIHGFMRCLVFTLEQVDLLVKEIDKVLDEAKQVSIIEKDTMFEICEKAEHVLSVKPEGYDERKEKLIPQ